MAKYTVHGGHAKHGAKYCGAVGYCSESLVDRQVKDAVIKYLRVAGHTVYDCTVDSGISQSAIITAIKKKINSYSGVTANISIHLNAASKSKADGKIKGTECCIYSTASSPTVTMASRICKNMNALGFTNRGNKVRTDLGVLKGIKNGGLNILVEIFFCDDQDDFNLYSKVGADAIGKAIAEGIVGKTIGTDWSKVFDATFYANANPDVVKVLGNSSQALLNHFLTYGIEEASRVGKTKSGFNVVTYAAKNPDLTDTFGQCTPGNYSPFYKHYCEYGYKEGRVTI